VRIHQVDGHLGGVEVEVVLLGDFEHAKVDSWIFVAGEADVVYFAGFACIASSFYSAASGEDAVGVLQTIPRFDPAVPPSANILTQNVTQLALECLHLEAVEADISAAPCSTKAGAVPFKQTQMRGC